MSYLPDNLYKKILDNIPIFCVDVYIYSKKTKSFLLVKRNNEPEKNKYCCPGGRVLKGEDLLNAAIRKVREELTVNIKKNKLHFFGVTNTFFKNSVFENISSHTINASFLYEVDDMDNFNIKLSSESSNFEWKNGKEKNIVKFVMVTIDKIKALKFKTSAIYLNFEQK